MLFRAILDVIALGSGEITSSCPREITLRLLLLAGT